MKRLLLLTFIIAVAVIGISTRNRTQAQSIDYRYFSHNSAQHKAASCSECHQREDPKATTPKFPSHSACIKCHVAQFTSQPLTICANCHENVKTTTAPVQAFPSRHSFDASFDSKQHEAHMAFPMPGGGKIECATCHKVTGAGETLPGHPECYTCHTKGADSRAAEKSQCVTCHGAATGAVKTYASLQQSLFYRYRFTHTQHDARNQCADCHTVSGRDALPPSKPVARKEHKSTCFTCHNGSRAFTDQFGSCQRCHGDSFKAPGGA